MKQSLSYYIVLLVLKLKGLKKDFSKDPIDFKKIRKQDVHDPKEKLFRNYKVNKFKVSKSSITELKQHQPADKLVLFIHGGAFISGPAIHHWDVIKEILKETSHNAWMVNYPKAPEHNILEISANIDEVYLKAIEFYPNKDIILIGDSVGGTLIAALTQRLVQKSIKLPLKVILVSPVMDASLTNPQIDELDKRDPMLSKVGVLSAKKMCAGNYSLTDPMISPLYGNFNNFPRTILYLAKNDITYSDQKLVVQKFEHAGIDVEVKVGENMPHIWPFLPVMDEAKLALREIISELNK